MSLLGRDVADGMRRLPAHPEVRRAFERWREAEHRALGADRAEVADEALLAVGPSCR
ncbi:hypothetical protein [Actinomycetospora sp. NBRC 106375]|uniref:hypothetical protein n=1 Tax=Actinomycetospora sp. NBRC 106375 TaxID=3032207 RepID=UPI0025540367|nr:hypothetical protein [Actinomycetospora sp. NBRC 106375]